LAFNSLYGPEKAAVCLRLGAGLILLKEEFAFETVQFWLCQAFSSPLHNRECSFNRQQPLNRPARFRIGPWAAKIRLF